MAKKGPTVETVDLNDCLPYERVLTNFVCLEKQSNDLFIFLRPSRLLFTIAAV